MQKTILRVASATLLITSLGVVAQATPSFHASLKKAVKAVQANADEDAKAPYHWLSPSVIRAGLVDPGLSISAGEAYATYQGRTFSMKTLQANLAITDAIELFYGKQYVLAKGRSSTSRFDVADDFYGARVVVVRPTSENSTSVALQYEAMRTDTASAVQGGNSETFNSPQINLYSVNVQDAHTNQYQFMYGTVRVPGTGDAKTYSIGAGKDFWLSNSLAARLQLNLVDQSYTIPGESSNFQVKSIAYGALAYTPTPWLALIGDLTVLPNGIPFSGGDFTGISAFEVYAPGGIVDDLRTSFVAFGSLKLVLHGKF